MDLHDLRREYAQSGLSEAALDDSPFIQFQQWFDEINRPETIDATAMVLATVDASGVPHQRTVLLKSVDQEGFVFFTNYESQKGQDIAANPNVNLIFAWYALERQVIIQGCAEKVSEAESDAYFASRPRDSQVAAWCSRQSTMVPDRAMLDATFDELKTVWKDEEIKRPPFWGGYRVVPQQFEFWQGRKSRLHDRLVYSREQQGWNVSRLAP